MLFGLALMHPGPLLADLWRHYGGGPEQLMSRGADVEDVADLAAHLPRDSAVMLAAVPRAELEAWDLQAHLLATAVDYLAGANWQRTGKRSGKPKPLKRPKAPQRGTEAGHENAEGFREWYAAQPGGRALKGAKASPSGDGPPVWEATTE